MEADPTTSCCSIMVRLYSASLFPKTHRTASISTKKKSSDILVGTHTFQFTHTTLGFVEQDNPHDTYVMPPLRDWDIEALEKACGGTPFPAGRLQKLDRAGLLGISLSDDLPTVSIADDDDESSDKEGVISEGNPRGGVVLSRPVGIDPAVLSALRALVSTDQEWTDAGEAVGNFAAEANPDNERRARLAARTAIEIEIASKATTLEEDRELLKRLQSSKSGSEDPDELMAIMFRIEKKKLLKETLDRLR